MEADVFVLGAGAGGTGCIYSLIKNGFRVAVCDKFSDFGGNMVFSGISCWEPGVSLPGLHELLACELEKKGAHAAHTIPNCNLFYPENGDNWENHDFEKYPWGLSVMDEQAVYADTLREYALNYMRQTKRFQFDEVDMIRAIHTVLSPYEQNLTTFFETSIEDVICEGRNVKAIRLSDGTEIHAKYFVDAGGGIPLARMCGCAYRSGTEGKEDYGEPSATERTDLLNGVTYVFRIRKTEDEEYMDDIPEPYDTGEVLKETVISCFNTYPNGDINVNMLPTMSGREYLDLEANADFEGTCRVWRYWNYLQRACGMKGYRLIKIYAPGIREDYRLIGKRILTENDLREGLHKENLSDSVIAVADHAMDIHGEGGLSRSVSRPYGIPIECCMTNEFDNLFVSSRGASFTHIAASSARLSRTMLSLGEGVGAYISMLLSKDKSCFEKINAKVSDFLNALEY